MARFNEETPDDPNVRYFSYGAYFEPSWSNAFRIPWGVVYEREGEQSTSGSHTCAVLIPVLSGLVRSLVGRLD